MFMPKEIQDEVPQGSILSPPTLYSLYVMITPPPPKSQVSSDDDAYIHNRLQRKLHSQKTAMQPHFNSCSVSNGP
jgi:hypothetical protein